MAILKRLPSQGKLIYTSEGMLVIKTPAECIKWPQELRMRITKSYAPPRTLMGIAAYRQTYVDTGGQDEVFIVGKQKQQVMVRQPYETVKHNHVVILRTEIIDVADKRAMFLYHDEVVMRVLMVYAFLRKKTIPGMPKLEVYDYDI